tara:strand:+ start:192 stop:488 length:297 start_codon:yes stop_codon:yes gene_type:complete
MIDTDDLDNMSRRDLVELTVYLLEAYNESLAEVKRLRSLDDLLRSMEKDGITASGYDHLLAEVKRLRGLLQEVADEYTDADGITYEIYCEFREGGEEE